VERFLPFHLLAAYARRIAFTLLAFVSLERRINASPFIADFISSSVASEQHHPEADCIQDSQVEEE